MKRNYLGLVLAGCLAAGTLSATTVWADAQKVVTLGADLSEDQKTAILKYFGILGNASVETLTITNQDERNHLASYVPIEQIGTHTYSCALVNPTGSGGIQVKTANLNWVTGNMIASTLSTAGVVNCEVLAAAPFEVSGTGALTGVIMAYEQASGTTLDPTKKELATQELVTTGTIANDVGQKEATNIVNEVKIQIIEGQVVDSAEVKKIVDDVVDSSTVTVELSDEDRQLLTDLADQIAQQQYSYDDVKETLQRVEENTNANSSTNTNDNTNNNTNTNNNSNSTVININNGSSSDSSSSAASSESETAASSEAASTESQTENPDSILSQTDVAALEDLTGTDVITTTTDETETDSASEASSTENAQTEAVQPAEPQTDDSGLVITSTENYSDQGAAGETSAVTPEETPGTETSLPTTEAATETAQTEGQTENVLSFDQQPVIASGNQDQPEVNVTGTSIVRLLFPKSDILPVSGILTVTDGEGSTVASVDLSADSAQSASAALTDAQIQSQAGWTVENGGTAVLVNIGQVLSTDTAYTIAFSGTVAQSADASAIDSAPKAEVSLQTTLTTGSYGASLAIADMDSLKVGSTVSGSYLLNDTVTSAQVTAYDPSYVSVEETDGGFTLTLLQAGTSELTVTFLNADGTEAGTETIQVTAFA